MSRGGTFVRRLINYNTPWRINNSLPAQLWLEWYIGVAQLRLPICTAAVMSFWCFIVGCGHTRSRETRVHPGSDSLVWSKQTENVIHLIFLTSSLPVSSTSEESVQRALLTVKLLLNAGSRTNAGVLPSSSNTESSEYETHSSYVIATMHRHLVLTHTLLLVFKITM